MNKVKVGLVQMNTTFNKVAYLPYTIGLLQAYYMKNGKNIADTVFSELIFESCAVKVAVEKLICSNLVFFSTYAWNFQLSIAIAKKLKEVAPNTVIVFGGPQIPPSTIDPKNITQFLQKYPFIDIICHGEGERICTQIIDNFITKNWSSIPSISYYAENEYKIALELYRETKLNLIPSPYLLGIFDQLLEKYHDYEWLVLWESNRGCPYSCAYCCWGRSDQNHVYNFPMQRIKDELKWFSEHKIKFTLSCDSNFGMFKRDIELAEYVAELYKTTGYPQKMSFFNAKNANDRIIKINEILNNAGLETDVSLSIQSVSPTVLQNINRKNIPFKTFNEIQRYFFKKKISTFTDIILNLPGETYNSFIEGIDIIISNGQFNRISFLNLIILPNSRMAQPDYISKFGIKTVLSAIVPTHRNKNNDELIDELQEIVISSSSMPEEAWRKTRVWAWMCSFLFFSKILQIPLIIFMDKANLPISKIIEAFIIIDSRFPVFSNITKILFDAAESIQKVDQNFVFQKIILVYIGHTRNIFLLNLLKMKK